jgi:hypothetical protein
MVPTVVPVIKKQWPSHISGGSCTLLVLKSSNSRIISTWWHNNREFAQKDAQSIHWECLSIHPGYSSSPKAYVTLFWRTQYESDIYHISSRGKNLIIYQTPLSIQSWPDHCLPHFPLKGYKLAFHWNSYNLAAIWQEIQFQLVTVTTSIRKWNSKPSGRWQFVALSSMRE